MATSPYSIEVRGLNLWYGQHHALHDINVAFHRNLITAIVGPSGCGKSTLLRCLNRMNDTIEGVRVAGRVTFDGRNILEPGIDLTALRRHLGMVFQRPNPFPLSVFENVAFGPRVHGTSSRERLMEIARSSLAAVGLWDEGRGALHRPALDLPLGQQQQLCLARVLAVDPEVVLLDEPCSALDPISTTRIEDLMRTLRGRYTIIIVTHNMQQAARTSDRTVFLMDGVLVEEGPTERLFHAPADPRTERYLTGKL